MSKVPVRATFGPAICTLLVLSLLMSSVTTEDAGGAPGTVTQFSSGTSSVDIEFDQVFGEDYTDLAVKLPRLSNALGVSVDLTGSVHEGANLTQTISTAEDWANGNQKPAGHLIRGDEGFHLNLNNISLFKDEEEITADQDVRGVASGDFNNDSRDDLVVTNYGSNTATVYLQNATGKLNKDLVLATDTQPIMVEVSDLNDDGRDDFAVGTSSGMSVNIFLSDSTGGFTKSTLSLSRQVLDLDIADLNDDGLDDLVLATYFAYGVIYFQNSAGSFILHREFRIDTGGYGYTYYARGCAAGDFNDDGRTDVAFTVSTTYTGIWSYQFYGMVKVHLQSSSNTFSTSYSYRYYAYNYAYGIDAGDVNGDGRDDIVITNHYTDQVRLFTQRPSGGFYNGIVIFKVGRPTWPEIGDLDGDGVGDAMVGSTNKNIAVLLQRGGSLGRINWTLQADNPIQQIALGDLNNDSRMDAASANTDGNSVSIWIQKDVFSATWTSHRIDLAAALIEINFTTTIDDNGGNTSLQYSFDRTNWTDMVSGLPVDTPTRPTDLWLKLTTSATRMNKIDVVKSVKMDMTFSSFPADITFDVGADGTVDWEKTGEVISVVTADGFEDAITEYVLDPEHPPDAGGWVTVPITAHSATPGYLHMSNLRLLYNNASSAPNVLGPANDTYVNGTPTFRFSAQDDNDDDLKYVVQITTTEFNDTFNTFIFDMRDSLYDNTTGEGFPRSSFPEGSNARFTLPEVYGLEMDTTYRWRVLAYDGHLVSDPSLPQTITVDTTPPVGRADSPRYSDTLDFSVSWSADDPSPGAGLAPVATYDVQYRTLDGPAWTDWLAGTAEPSAVFHGEEGVTYLFRMRARDAVMNPSRYSNEGDTLTTVDTIAPAVNVISPLPGEAATVGKQELRMDASDDTYRLVLGDVVYSLDGGPWANMTRLMASTTLWRASIDTSSLPDGEYPLTFRATDAARHMTEVTATLVVDNHDPTCDVVSPRTGDMVTGVHLFRIIAEDTLGIGAVDIQLFGLPGISSGTAHYNASSGTWELAVDTTSIGEGQASYTARSIDTSGRRSPVVGPIHYTVDNQGPIIEIINPSPDTFITTETATVRATVTDLHFDPASEEAFVKIGNGGWTAMTPAGSEFLYNWDLTGVADGEHVVQVRASDRASQLTIVEIIAMVDRNPPLVSIIEPGAGAAVTGEVTVEVEVAEPFLDGVQLSLDGSHWTDVVDGTATFDSNQYPDGQYILTAKAADLNGAAAASKISIFVDNTPPDIIPTGFPGMGQQVGGEVPFEMFVDDDDVVGTVRADVGGVIDILTVKPSTGVYLFTLDTSGIPDGPLDVVFLATDRAGNEASLTWTVIVDNTPPEIQVLAPGRDADGTIEFTVDITDVSTVSQVQLKIGDRPWVFMFRAADGTYRHQWDTGTRDNDKDINFKVRATDEAGNTGEQVQKLDVTNPPYAYIGLALLMALVLLGIYILYQRRGKAEEVLSTEGVTTTEMDDPATEGEAGKGPDTEPSERSEGERTGEHEEEGAETIHAHAQDEWVESKDE